MVQFISRYALKGGKVSEDEAQLASRHVQALWAAWQLEGSDAVREQLIEFYLPFARMMAAKSYQKRTFMELEFMDFLQYASLGLIESIERFRPERGVSFETFAGVRISGAILNGIESMSEKQVQVSARRRLIDERVQSLHPRPQPEAVAEHDATAKTDVFGQLAHIAMGLAMGFVLEDTGMMQADDDDHYPDTLYQQVEMKQLQRRLHSYLAELPHNESKVIHYHYLQHWAFDEIALALKLSKGRVSQLHKSALGRLRGKMQEQGGLDCHL